MDWVFGEGEKLGVYGQLKFFVDPQNKSYKWVIGFINKRSESKALQWADHNIWKYICHIALYDAYNFPLSHCTFYEPHSLGKIVLQCNIVTAHAYYKVLCNNVLHYCLCFNRMLYAFWITNKQPILFIAVFLGPLWARIIQMLKSLKSMVFLTQFMSGGSFKLFIVDIEKIQTSILKISTITCTEWAIVRRNAHFHELKQK